MDNLKYRYFNLGISFMRMFKEHLQVVRLQSDPPGPANSWSLFSCMV